MFAQSHVQMDLVLSASGVARLGFLSLLLDAVHVASSPFLRSTVRLEPAMLVLDFLHLGLSPSPHSFARLGRNFGKVGLGPEE